MQDNYSERSIPEHFESETKLINTLSDLASNGEYVFRGYNTQDQLLPNIIRGGKNSDFSDVEFDLLNDFEKYGSHYFSASNAIDFMSCGQHYGLPTRLLDFTYNPFIALRFALFSAKSSGTYKKNPEDRDYYYIRFCKIDNNIHLNGIPVHKKPTFGSFKSDSISKKCTDLIQMYSACLSDVNYKFFKQYINGLFECDYQAGDDIGYYKDMITKKINSEKLCFIDPSQSNQRIIMQQGLFMLPYTLDKSKHYQLMEKNTAVIKVHKDLRDSLLSYLDTLGYNAFRLMPDLSNVCEAVKQKVKDERSRRRELFRKSKAKESMR